MLYEVLILAKEKKNYTMRDASEFNWFRTFWQLFVCAGLYGLWFRLIYRLEIHGMENVPKEHNEYIVCPNHLSALDPPLICGIMPRRVTFMAKKELFETPFLCWWLDWLGAFAVNREKLGVSTIKTAMTIKKTKWALGIFPQGTRGEFGVIKDITKGFASLAKVTKCGILPIGIVGTQEKKKIPFTGKIIVKIGEMIPYSDDIDGMVQEWIIAVQKLTGFKYEESTNG